MKRAEMVLVPILFAVSTLGATAQATNASTADIWSNTDSFSSTCLGFTDTYPTLLYNQAVSAMGRLGYSPAVGWLGSKFTSSAFLGTVLRDYGVYAHTHADNYWAPYPNVDSAILQDPGAGKCGSTSDRIYSSSIKAATKNTLYNLVIMSTCKLGSSSSTMPGAFQIAKSKSSTRREFFLGYTYLTYDSSQYRFEQAFFNYLTGDLYGLRTASQAFTYAMSIGGYSSPDSADPFVPNWWGNPNYNGRA
jgi:hypothetical protein